MQQLVHSASDPGGKMFEVISYFLQRLHSTQANARQQAIKVSFMVEESKVTARAAQKPPKCYPFRFRDDFGRSSVNLFL
jgi:hypothetical protein